MITQVTRMSYFRIAHDTTTHLPPKTLLKQVFYLFWDDCNTWEELETMVMQISLGKQI